MIHHSQQNKFNFCFQTSQPSQSTNHISLDRPKCMLGRTTLIADYTNLAPVTIHELVTFGSYKCVETSKLARYFRVPLIEDHVPQIETDVG